MANSFLALPAPVGDGSGAAVNVSAMGGTKTIIVGGNLRGIVSIEVATDTAGTLFQAIKSFQGVGECTLDTAAMWMRITVIGFKGGAPVVAVGANTDGASNAQLNVTAGSGTGAAVDISALPGLKTLVVPGGFTGLLVLELSEDNVAFEPVVTSQSGGAITFLSYGKFARIVRVGVNGGTTPEVWIGGSSQGANVGSSAGQTGLKNEVVVPDLGGASVHDMNPPGFDGTVNVIRVLNTDPNSVINGVKAQADGTLLLIVADDSNTAPFTLPLYQDGANGFRFPGSIDPGNAGARLNSNAAVLFCYNGTLQRWLAVAAWLDEFAGTTFIGLVQMQNGLDVQQGGLALGGAHNPTTGTLVATGLLQFFGSFNQDFEFQTSVLTPAALPAGVTNDYAPVGIGNARVLRLANGGAASLGGLAAPFTGGQKLTIRNLSAAPLTLLHESAGNPTLIQRFQLPGAANVVIPQFGSADVWYDGASARWTVG